MRYRHTGWLRREVRYLRLWLMTLPMRIEAWGYCRSEDFLIWLTGDDCLGLDPQEERTIGHVWLTIWRMGLAMGDGSKWEIVRRYSPIGGRYWVSVRRKT